MGGGKHVDFDKANGEVVANPNYKGDGDKWKYKLKISIEDVNSAHKFNVAPEADEII